MPCGGCGGGCGSACGHDEIVIDLIIVNWFGIYLKVFPIKEKGFSM